MYLEVYDISSGDFMMIYNEYYNSNNNDNNNKHNIYNNNNNNNSNSNVNSFNEWQVFRHTMTSCIDYLTFGDAIPYILFIRLNKTSVATLLSALFSLAIYLINNIHIKPLH